MSIGGFRKQMMETAHNLQSKLHCDCFKYIYDVEWDRGVIDAANIAHIRVMSTLGASFKPPSALYVIEGDQIDLKDFYKEIGWDYKAKKLNGQTINQYIRQRVKDTS